MRIALLCFAFSFAVFGQLPSGGSSGGGGVTSVIGTAGQIIASPTTGAVVLSAVPQTATGYPANVLLSGGGVSWTGNYGFTVSAASYVIQNVVYSSAQTNLTLAASDATLDRIDVIAVDNTGAAVVIQGTNSATPLLPDVDPSSQLQLTFVYVAANTTAPTSTVTTDIYHENTEWTSTKSGTPINMASTNFPHAGTVDVEATAATAGNYFRFQAPAPLDIATRNNLIFYIRSKAAWPSTRSLTLRWLSSGTPKGTAVTFREGSFGFSSSNTTSYQQIVIPLSLFGAAGLSVNQVQFTVAGTGGTIGFYFDDAILQGGLSQSTAPSVSMIWRGDWNATATYAVNDVVRSAAGLSFVAVAASTGVTPAVGASWMAMSPAIRAVANGGTGVATLAAHGVVLGNAASAVNVTGAGTAGQVLTSNGASADPTFQAAAGGGGLTGITTNAIPKGQGASPVVSSGVTIADTTNNISTPGAYIAGNAGGTSGYVSFSGATSGAAGIAASAAAGTSILYLLPTTAGTAGQVLQDNGSATCPTLPTGAPALCHQTSWVNAATGTDGAWTAPTLLNGWVNYGAPYGPAQYMKDSHGRVWMRGLIKSGTTADGTTIFTLPVGYRPLSQTIQVTGSNLNAVCSLLFSTSGNVNIYGGCSAAQTDLESVSISVN